MKIEIVSSTSNLTNLSSIEYGQCFMVDECIYMKIIVSKSFLVEENYYAWAVNFNTNVIVGFPRDVMVQKLFHVNTIKFRV